MRAVVGPFGMLCLLEETTVGVYRGMLGKYEIHMVSPNQVLHFRRLYVLASKGEHLIPLRDHANPSILLIGYRTKIHRTSRAIPRLALSAKVELVHQLLGSARPLPSINSVPPPPARLVCVFPIHEAHVLVRGH